MRLAGQTKEEAARSYRSSLVPEGFTAFPFRANTPESYLDVLRSIFGTLFYVDSVNRFAEEGVDFISHLYVPEIDPITNEHHHDRADHCHLLKRMAGMCTSLVARFALIPSQFLRFKVFKYLYF